MVAPGTEHGFELCMESSTFGKLIKLGTFGDLSELTINRRSSRDWLGRPVYFPIILILYVKQMTSDT